ncbi:hypothetical protein HNR47_001978 [Methylopila jiangsuensis]|nr:hypothetical protein [Methylopila jiangsuensis]
MTSVDRGLRPIRMAMHSRVNWFVTLSILNVWPPWVRSSTKS